MIGESCTLWHIPSIWGELIMGDELGYLNNTEIIVWIVIGLLVAIGYYGFEYYLNKPDSTPDSTEEE